MTAPCGQVAELDLARTLWRQGLLREAEQALSSVPTESSVADRASALLILGNIAYERGNYVRAVEEWSAASGLYGRDGAMEAGVGVAAENLSMAQAKIARGGELAAQARHLTLQLAAALVLAVAALAIGCWMSRGREAGVQDP